MAPQTCAHTPLTVCTPCVPNSHVADMPLANPRLFPCLGDLVVLLLMTVWPIYSERCSMNPGTRLMWSFASYGPGGGHDPRLLNTLRGLGVAGQHGLVVDVMLHLTDALKAPLHIPGLREVLTTVHPASIGEKLVEQWRSPYLKALAQNQYACCVRLSHIVH